MTYRHQFPPQEHGQLLCEQYACCSFLRPFLFRSHHLPVTRHLRPPQLSNGKVETHVYGNSCTSLGVKIKQWPLGQNPEGRPGITTLHDPGLLPPPRPLPRSPSLCPPSLPRSPQISRTSEKLNNKVFILLALWNIVFETKSIHACVKVEEKKTAKTLDTIITIYTVKLLKWYFF